MKYFFVAAFVFVGVWNYATGLRCLRCDEVFNPILCTYIVKCGDDEVCGIEQVRNENGNIRYNLGCKSTQTCSDLKNLTDTTALKRSSHTSTYTTVCHECCDKDICNSAGCGQLGYPKDIGPICMDCQDIDNAGKCDKISACDQDEMCYIHEKVLFHLNVFTSSCVPKYVCDGTHGSVFGKRKRRDEDGVEARSSTFCSQCCVGNLCNDHCGATTPTPSTTHSTGVSGWKFLLGFLTNYEYGNLGKYYVQCLITSDVAGTLDIKVPYLNIYDQRTLNVGVNTVNLSYTIHPNNTVIENKAVYIETSTNVNVFGLNFGHHSTDGFTVIPIDRLSTEYVVVTEEPYSSSSDLRSEVLVAATMNNTSVHFKFNTSGTIRYNQQSYDNNRDLTISLNELDTFQIMHSHDLTGTIVSSSSPIAVISGNRCGNAFVSGCSHFSEMIPPVKSLGQNYIIPLFEVSHYTTRYVRVIGTQDNTHVNYTINGLTSSTYLNKGQTFDKLFKNGEFMFLNSSKPVLVSVFVQSSHADPFMTLVPSVNQYLSNYTFAVPEGFTSHGVIIIDSSFTSGLYLDGNLISRSCFMVKTAFSNMQYCLMEIPVTPGYHTLYHSTRQTFALYIYGRKTDDAYGFSAGMNLGP